MTFSTDYSRFIMGSAGDGGVNGLMWQNDDQTFSPVIVYRDNAGTYRTTVDPDGWHFTAGYSPGMPPLSIISNGDSMEGFPGELIVPIEQGQEGGLYIWRADTLGDALHEYAQFGPRFFVAGAINQGMTPEQAGLLWLNLSPDQKARLMPGQGGGVFSTMVLPLLQGLTFSNAPGPLKFLAAASMAFSSIMNAATYASNLAQAVYSGETTLTETLTTALQNAQVYGQNALTNIQNFAESVFSDAKAIADNSFASGDITIAENAQEIADHALSIADQAAGEVQALDEAQAAQAAADQAAAQAAAAEQAAAQAKAATQAAAAGAEGQAINTASISAKVAEGVAGAGATAAVAAAVSGGSGAGSSIADQAFANATQEASALVPGMVVNADGSATLPDGTFIPTQGTVTADGAIMLPDGTMISTDGTVTLPTGVKIAGAAGNAIKTLANAPGSLTTGAAASTAAQGFNAAAALQSALSAAATGAIQTAYRAQTGSALPMNVTPGAAQTTTTQSFLSSSTFKLLAAGGAAVLLLR